MRSGASSSASVVTVQPRGMRLRVLSRDGGWTEVVDPKTDQKGWIFRRYIKASGPPSDVQQTEPSTTGLTQQRALF
ncbi:SH3 domain-containing protein [Bradyrhizobium sp. LHD-71]|uniref:SH3 domain-containing protein n=1 Tax=Bradyrhizobium sp. LHD-71 TaxID=3072141 RepID=UPI0028105435|nr:SH3 domain-containing protein [Bradyrhizobium sp. LHD-71]MDQ8730129.1 SH3 domain-containing protein [Bradyrhizobium sp. LHD-71]